MADEKTPAVEPTSYLELSDEEAMARGPEFIATPAEATPAEPDEDDDDDKDLNKEVAGDPANPAADAAKTPTPADEDDEDKEKDKAKVVDPTAEGGEGKTHADKDAKPTEAKGAETAKPATPAQDPDPSTPAQIDYKAEYEKVFAPFKANGRDFTVKNAADAVALMQMGVSYNKKMAALKPVLKTMKLLEKNGLLDEAKLSYLIDLDKKNPEAISRLVKESGLDPLDLDAEKASGYKPQTYTVDEREIDLDNEMEAIHGTPTYTRTLEIVGQKWDSASKQVVANNPQLLGVINGHIASGIYDLIANEVESERVFGRLKGLSDIEAYKQVGDAIHARGGFNHLASQGKPAAAASIVVQPKPREVDDTKLRDKKRAASSTKPAAPAKTAQDFNPLNLSDEEFSKLGTDKFL